MEFYNLRKMLIKLVSSVENKNESEKNEILKNIKQNLRNSENNHDETIKNLEKFVNELEEENVVESVQLLQDVLVSYTNIEDTDMKNIEQIDDEV